MLPDVQTLITELDLARHAEGGYYRQTYRSERNIELSASGDVFPNARPFSTAIYYLLCDDDFSALHRIRSDEIWHFYRGSGLAIYAIDPTGTLTQNRLGSGIERGEAYQIVVKAGCWFGAMLEEPGSYALVGCTVSPGFDFRDFDLADRNSLIQAFPHHRKIIERLTK
jgi:predicted cupin superfamily sugar epimerase